jgi:chromate reductase, NAD(P)H dehydrogenase (quinone)
MTSAGAGHEGDPARSLTQPVRVLQVCGSLRKQSANRLALQVAADWLRKQRDVRVEVVEAPIGRVESFNDDFGEHPGTGAARWRTHISQADLVMIAAPEFAGGIAGALKNALDWVVGSGELYSMPVAIMSVGTTGGIRALQQLAQTLTWQGAHVVCGLSVESVRTKSDRDGPITDLITIHDIEDWSAALLSAHSKTIPERVSMAQGVLSRYGVDPLRIDLFD